MAFKYFPLVYFLSCRKHTFCKVFVWFFNQALPNHFIEFLFLFCRKSIFGVVHLHEIGVQSSVGAFGRANRNRGEVKVVQGIGRDCGQDRGILPIIVWGHNQVDRCEKSDGNSRCPRSFCRKACLWWAERMINNRYDKLTFGSEIWDNPCIVEESKNSFKLSILEPDWPLDNQTYVIVALQ